MICTSLSCAWSFNNLTFCVKYMNHMTAEMQFAFCWHWIQNPGFVEKIHFYWKITHLKEFRKIVEISNSSISKSLFAIMKHFIQYVCITSRILPLKKVSCPLLKKCHQSQTKLEGKSEKQQLWRNPILEPMPPASSLFFNHRALYLSNHLYTNSMDPPLYFKSPEIHWWFTFSGNLLSSPSCGNLS